MIEHGVLFNGDRPAVADLIKPGKPLSIAIVQADMNGEFPPGFVNEDIDKRINGGLTGEYGARARKFEPDIENITRNAVRYWYEGEIKFVKHDEKPDLTIFAFDSKARSSFATFPPNDHADPSFKGTDRAYMGISSRRVGETTEELIRHEFGHSMGILHPRDAMRQTRETNPVSCDNELAEEDFRPGTVQDQPGYMSYGEHSESAYDAGVRQVISPRSAPASSPKP